MDELKEILTITFGLVVYIVLTAAFSDLLEGYLNLMIGAGFAGYALAIVKIMDLSSLFDIFSFFRYR